MLANIAQYLPDYQFTTIAGNSSWLEGNKDAGIRFLMAIIKANRFINDKTNREEAIKIMMKHHKMNRKYSEMAYQMVVEDLKPIRNDASPNMKGIEEAIKEEVERESLKTSYPAAQFIDESYRLEALKRLGG